MKSFVYFEDQQGGVGFYDITSIADFTSLYGWMCDDCKSGDIEMVKWMENAEVGTMYSHRLGYLVRLKDDWQFSDDRE